MFQFTTTNIVNSVEQFLEDNLQVGLKFGPTFKIEDTNRKVCIYKAPFVKETPDKAVIKLSEFSEIDKHDMYRLCVYVKSEADQNPLYANSYGFKGKPFYFEFKAGSTAKQIKDVADKFLLALYDSRQLEFSSDENKLTITCVNGYLRIVKVEVELWKTEEYDIIETCKVIPNDAEEATNEVKSKNITITIGNPGFGTYEQLLNDVYLPTIENLSLHGLNSAQKPIFGGKYTQYTVHLRKELEGYAGGIGINNPVESITNHVFFVESGIADDFETMIKKIQNDDKEAGIKTVTENESTSDSDTI